MSFGKTLDLRLFQMLLHLCMNGFHSQLIGATLPAVWEWVNVTSVKLEAQVRRLPSVCIYLIQGTVLCFSISDTVICLVIFGSILSLLTELPVRLWTQFYEP